MYGFILHFKIFAASCIPDITTPASVTSALFTGVQLSWRCYDPPTTGFNITYTLTNKDQCNAPDDLLYQPQIIDCMSCNHVLSIIPIPFHDNISIDCYSLDLPALYPYSTYSEVIESRPFGVLFRSTKNGSFVTGEAGGCQFEFYSNEVLEVQRNDIVLPLSESACGVAELSRIHNRKVMNSSPVSAKVVS